MQEEVSQETDYLGLFIQLNYKGMLNKMLVLAKGTTISLLISPLPMLSGRYRCQYACRLQVKVFVLCVAQPPDKTSLCISLHL